MKKRIFAILLSLVLALAIVTPAFAADEPRFRIFPESGGMVNLGASDLGSGVAAGLSAAVNTENKSVTLYMKSHTGNGAIDVVLPGSNWVLWVSVSGSNRLQVKEINEGSKKTACALRTNGDMIIYAAENNAALNITGSWGTESAPKTLDRNFYAFSAKSVTFVNINSGARQAINVSFALYTPGAEGKVVYPFDCETTIGDSYFNYENTSNYVHANEEVQLTLTGATYFRVESDIKNAANEIALWNVTYAKGFTGIANYKIKNGYHVGGAYGYEKFECQTEPRCTTYVGGTEYTHYEAKPCNWNQLTKLTASQIKAGLQFDYKQGAILPDRFEGSGFIASAVWRDSENNVVTGKPVEFNKTYAAYVTIVPYGSYSLPAWSSVSPLTQVMPDWGFSVGTNTVNLYQQPQLRVTAKVLTPENMSITKQPADAAVNTARKAVFKVETKGTVTGYQWMVSKDGKTGWTALEDKVTTGGSTPITGAKTNTLTYQYNDAYKTLYFRCIVSGYLNGHPGTLPTDVVKYVYTEKITGTNMRITSQPSDVTLTAEDQYAEFTVETEGDVSGYQWQYSSNGTSFANFYDGNTAQYIVTKGTKTNHLINRYNSNYNPEYFRCAITGVVDGSVTTIYSKVVKSELVKKISSVEFEDINLPEHKQPLDTTSGKAVTPHVKLTKIEFRMFNKFLDYYETGDNIGVLCYVEALDGYTFDTNTTGKLEETEFYKTELSSGNTQAVITFSYRVPAPADGVPIQAAYYTLTPPVAGATPSKEIGATREIGSGGKHTFVRSPQATSVTWDPADAYFKGDTAYTVTFTVETEDSLNPETYTGYPACFDENTKFSLSVDGGSTFNVEPSSVEITSPKTATISYTFPKTGALNEIVLLELSGYDLPDGKGALPTAAKSDTEGAAVDLVAYSKNSIYTTEAAPGDKVQINVTVKIAEGTRLAPDATATLTAKNGTKLASVVNNADGKSHFVQTGGTSYTFRFEYTIPGGGLRGDADLDGKVLAKDARLVLRASAKLETLTGQAFANSDLDGNGKLTAKEARLILRFSAKLETSI